MVFADKPMPQSFSVNKKFPTVCKVNEKNQKKQDIDPYTGTPVSDKVHRVEISGGLQIP